MIEKKFLSVYGEGSNIRVHNKIVNMVTNIKRLGKVYNIGGFNEEKNINIVALIIDTILRVMREEPEYRKLLKLDIKNINHSLITYVQDRLGHESMYVIMELTKISTELEWYPYSQKWAENL